MEFKQTKREDCYGIKITVEDNGREIGRGTLYVMYNDLHPENGRPFGLMEDIYVEEAFRGTGIGTKIVNSVIEAAKEHNCYKLIGQCRYGKEKVHELYQKLGFKDHGKNFRMDLL